MTLEQQVADLVAATTSLTSVVNTELSNVRQENTNFKNSIIDPKGQGVFNGITIGRGGGENVFNTTVGSASLQLNTTGLYNSAFGSASLQLNTTGLYNSAFGYVSLRFNTTGINNSAFGRSSLYNNEEGSQNSAFGAGSLQFNTTGINNSGFGHTALYYNEEGSQNSAFGTGSLSSLVDFSNCTGIGSYAEVSGSNQVQLGDSSTSTYVYGTVQNRSDIRDKTDVRNTILGLDFIKSLRPVDYRWDMREDYKPTMPKALGMEATDEQKAAYQSEVKIWLEACKLKNIVHNGTKKRNRFHHGLIAQEVKAVLTQKGIDFGGYQDHSISGGDDVLSLGYDQFIAPLIKAVQELSAQNEALVARISVLESNLK